MNEKKLNWKKEDEKFKRQMNAEGRFKLIDHAFTEPYFWDSHEEKMVSLVEACKLLNESLKELQEFQEATALKVEIPESWLLPETEEEEEKKEQCFECGERAVKEKSFSFFGSPMHVTYKCCGACGHQYGYEKHDKEESSDDE